MAVWKWREVITPLFLFFSVLIIYIHHLSPSVYGGDDGDFLSAIAAKSVPHPSGYPLFMILGILFSYLPVNQTLAWKVGLISAISSSGAIVLMYLLVKELVKSRLLAVITSLTLAFFYTFWLYAEFAEVFALNNFFMLLLLFLSVLYYKRKKISFLYVLFFFTGLSFSNHQLTILLLPSLALLILATNWRIFLRPKVTGICFLFFLLGLLPYAYIPLGILSNNNPPLSWTEGTTVKDFIWFILRLHYGWNFKEGIGLGLRFLSLKTYFMALITGLSLAGVILSISGMIYMLKKKSVLFFIAFFIAFFLFGPFFLIYGHYSIVNGFIYGFMERFYMTSFLFLLVFFPFGILFLVNGIMQILRKLSPVFAKKPYYRFLFSSIFLIIPFFLFISNYSKTDLHGVWVGDNFAKDILLSLPKNSTLFLQGDTFLFNTLYAQYALGIRRDIMVINLGTLQFDKNFIRAKKDIASQNSGLSGSVITIKTIASFKEKRPVFASSKIQYADKEQGQLIWIPYGLLFRLVGKGDQNVDVETFLSGQERLLNTFHLPKKDQDKKISERGLTLTQASVNYAQAYVNTANYTLSYYKDLQKAKNFYQKSIEFAPIKSDGYLGVGFYYLQNKDCRQAEKFFNQAISVDPARKLGYIMLYATYSKCFSDKKSSNTVAQKFFLLFDKSILKEIEEGREKVD